MKLKFSIWEFTRIDPSKPAKGNTRALRLSVEQALESPERVGAVMVKHTSKPTDSTWAQVSEKLSEKFGVHFDSEGSVRVFGGTVYQQFMPETEVECEL